MRLPSFPTTLWSDIERARGKDRDAMGQLLERYLPPVRRYLLARGLQPADADDMVQEVFQRICGKDLLRKADRSKGRFRWLILGITRNVLRGQSKVQNAEKRGGGKAPLSLQDEEDLPDVLADSTEDVEFDRLWVANLLDRAIRAAREEEAEKGTRYVTLLQLKLLEGATYEQLCERFGLKLQDVKNHLHRGRLAISRHIRRAVEGYSSSTEEYDAEVRLVNRYLMKGKGRL